MNKAQLLVGLLALVGAVAGCGTDQLVLVDAVIDAGDANEKPIIVYAPDATGRQSTADATQAQDAAVDEQDAGADSTVADAGDGSKDGSDGSMDSGDGFDGFACDPTKSPHDDSCVIDEPFGVFVAPTTSGGSDTSGAGSRAKPYATIAHALASLGGKHRVYVCDDTYVEAVTIQTPTSLYGGLVCPGGDAGAPWSYEAGGSAKVSAASNQIPLTLPGVDAGISIEDMWFAAANASGQDTAGNGLSSIAALVSASNVAFRRCTMSAGVGDNGSNGTTGTNYMDATAPAGGTIGPPQGAAGGSITCNDGTSSMGGAGGPNPVFVPGQGFVGDPDAGGGNGSAQPMPAVTAPLDGLGGTSSNYTCLTAAHLGGNGAAGTAAPGSPTLGTLTASGWSPVHGGNGQAGNPGQGGGGGGGSIALACISSSVTLEGCALTSARAGHGGKGGDGQQGQGGGAPGQNGAQDMVGECFGNFGGSGAGGGGGTGGAGGITACIVFRGSALGGTQTCARGSAGQPGAYGYGGVGGISVPGNVGTSGPNGANGAPGTAQDTVQVP